MNIIELYKTFYKLLTTKHKKSLLVVFAFTSISSLLEVALLSTMSLTISHIVVQPNFHSTAYHFGGFKFDINYLLILIALLIVCSTAVSVFSIRVTSQAAAKIASNVCEKMFSNVLSGSYEEILKIGSTEIAKNISIEIQRLTLGFILPAILLIPRLFLLCALITGLFVVAGLESIVPITVLGVFYFLIYTIIKPQLKINDVAINSGYSDLLRTAKSGLGASAELKILELTLLYEHRLSKFVQSANNAHASNVVLQNAPRYVVESCIYLLIITAVFALSVSDNGLNSEKVTLVSMLGLGALKLLPTLQQIYMLVTLIKGHETSVNIAVDYTSEKSLYRKKQYMSDPSAIMDLRNIRVEGSGDTPRLQDVSIRLPTKGHWGLVGQSGSGKSTLLKVIAGLIPPDSGTIQIEQEKQNLKIGYIPQAVYIIQGSFLENITFMESLSDIDRDAFEKAIVDADLAELYDQLGRDPYAKIQEAGENMSGGQRQRVGIARALYRKSDLLLCDEITSSLDTESEKRVLQTLTKLSSDRTVISVMHKREIFHNCSTLILLSNGQIMESAEISN